ncbi:MAG TPA: hypothetical protein VMV49_07815 [Candidatus Deferrimicrobium sp.]|nr:hypothetical protein [Candidatus Deferrimicrobium sp.]
MRYEKEALEVNIMSATGFIIREGPTLIEEIENNFNQYKDRLVGYAYQLVKEGQISKTEAPLIIDLVETYIHLIKKVPKRKKRDPFYDRSCFERDFYDIYEYFLNLKKFIVSSVFGEEKTIAFIYKSAEILWFVRYEKVFWDIVTYWTDKFDWTNKRQTLRAIFESESHLPNKAVDQILGHSVTWL